MSNKPMLQRLEHLHGYDSLNCYTADPENLNDGSGLNRFQTRAWQGPVQQIL